MEKQKARVQPFGPKKVEQEKMNYENTFRRVKKIAQQQKSDISENVLDHIEGYAKRINLASDTFNDYLN